MEESFERFNGILTHDSMSVTSGSMHDGECCIREMQVNPLHEVMNAGRRAVQLSQHNAVYYIDNPST